MIVKRLIMDKDDIIELFKRYQDGTCTDYEKELLERWYLQYNEEEIEISVAQIEEFGRQIFEQLPGSERIERKALGWQWLAASAAIVLLTIGLSVHFLNTKSASTLAVSNNIRPGTNNVILTLSNGKRINLNSETNGQIALQSGISITKSAGGLITYTAVNVTNHPASSIQNNLTTPVGGQWHVMLPDGTQVWLNDASSFSYPSSFSNQKERIVTLVGEAYFEVAKDKNHPFIVKNEQQKIEVLGTHFNVNSYKDEFSIKTTLLEGSVKVSSNTSHQFKLLTPGQQSILSADKLTVNNADVEEATAWKNGYFRFNDENIQSIMRKLSRWYDIDVIYSGNISDEGINGKVSRSRNISQVLNALEATKTLHFKVEGRRITVMK
jgi:transmembrane sensor